MSTYSFSPVLDKFLCRIVYKTYLSCCLRRVQMNVIGTSVSWLSGLQFRANDLELNSMAIEKGRVRRKSLNEPVIFLFSLSHEAELTNW